MVVLRYTSTSVPSSLCDGVRICRGPFPHRSAADEALAAGARGGMGLHTATTPM
jgi:hypothetical protein